MLPCGFIAGMATFVFVQIGPTECPKNKNLEKKID
jgi:hypothetical protein